MAADPSEAIARLLRTRVFGRRLIWIPRVRSTMDEARRRAAAAPQGTTIIAGEQSAGRGRRGRVFVSPPGGLYLSLILEPLPERHHSWRLGFALALAARQAVLAAGGPALSFKWPNDLLLGQAKVGGVLLELLTPAGGPARLLAGIGVNLGPDPSALDPAAEGAGAIPIPAVEGGACAFVAAGLLAEFEKLADLLLGGGWPDLFEQVRACMTPGAGASMVLQMPSGEELRGELVDLAPDGALVLRETESGDLRRIHHGEIASFSAGTSATSPGS